MSPTQRTPPNGKQGSKAAGSVSCATTSKKIGKTKSPCLSLPSKATLAAAAQALKAKEPSPYIPTTMTSSSKITMPPTSLSGKKTKGQKRNLEQDSDTAKIKGEFQFTDSIELFFKL